MNVGFAKVEITAWEPEIAMMGWGRMDNRTVGVKTPLFVRAAAFESHGKRVVVACLELMAISTAIRQEVIRRLDASALGMELEHDLMLTATHTHSAPGGYSHHVFLNLNAPGFSPVVFDAAVEGTVKAIEDAVSALQPASLSVARGQMPMSDPVAFNRSWFAYNLNEDVEPVIEERRDEATDRWMTMLVARDATGKALGCVNWFAVHCTSVHSENDHLHGDNKGIASIELEAEFDDGFVAIFAQDASGDVTPNYRYHRRRKKVIGHFDNDYESAEFNGRAQAKLARELMARAEAVQDESLWGATHYVDFADVEVSARHARGQTARTSSGVLGITMAEGTAEGPGPILGIKAFNRWLTRRKAASEGTDDPKIPMLEVGKGIEGRFLGRFALRGLKVPAVDPTIGYVKSVVNSGTLGPQPWIAESIPLQLMQIGPLLIVGLPFEATTVAGRRLRDLLLRLFETRGVSEVVIGSYCNEYSGYCTTFEEYQLQHYEAGYTIFGPHQLGAVMTMFEWMADRVDAMPLGVEPERFDIDEVMQRKFDRPWPVKRARPVW